MQLYIQVNLRQYTGIVDIPNPLTDAYQCALCQGQYRMLQRSCLNTPDGVIPPGLGPVPVKANYMLVPQPDESVIMLCRRCSRWFLQYTMWAAPLDTRLENLLYVRITGPRSAGLRTWFRDSLGSVTGQVDPGGLVDAHVDDVGGGRWRLEGRAGTTMDRPCAAVREVTGNEPFIEPRPEVVQEYL